MLMAQLIRASVYMCSGGMLSGVRSQCHTRKGCHNHNSLDGKLFLSIWDCKIHGYLVMQSMSIVPSAFCCYELGAIMNLVHTFPYIISKEIAYLIRQIYVCDYTYAISDGIKCRCVRTLNKRRHLFITQKTHLFIT